jgi:hypothetical protein
MQAVANDAVSESNFHLLFITPFSLAVNTTFPFVGAKYAEPFFGLDYCLILELQIKAIKIFKSRLAAILSFHIPKLSIYCYANHKLLLSA